MSVRAKFKCVSVTNHVGQASVHLEPVTSGSDENKSFYKYTPSGKIELSTINPEAAKQFEPGRE